MNCFVEDYENMKKLRIDNDQIQIYFDQVLQIINSQLNQKNMKLCMGLFSEDIDLAQEKCKKFKEQIEFLEKYPEIIKKEELNFIRQMQTNIMGMVK